MTMTYNANQPKNPQIELNEKEISEIPNDKELPLSYFQGVIDKHNADILKDLFDYAFEVIYDNTPDEPGRSRHLKSLYENHRIFDETDSLQYKAHSMIHMLINVINFQHIGMRKPKPSPKKL